MNVGVDYTYITDENIGCAWKEDNFWLYRLYIQKAEEIYPVRFDLWREATQRNTTKCCICRRNH